MAFQGSLAELHLPDIIQLVSVSGKTGVFHLTDRSHHGEIWLYEGRIVHAEVDDLSGEEAVYALAIWRSGEFRFEPGSAAPRQTIQKSNTGLLMEAARRLDEWRVLSKKIPSVELVPEFVILENREGQINLNTMEWLLLSKIDGQRSRQADRLGGGHERLRRGEAPVRPGRDEPDPPEGRRPGGRRSRARGGRCGAGHGPARAAPRAARRRSRGAAPAGRSRSGASDAVGRAGVATRRAARRVRRAARARRRDGGAEALRARARRARPRRRAGGDRGGPAADRARRRHPQGQRGGRGGAAPVEAPALPAGRPPRAAAAISSRQRSSTTSQRYSRAT